MGIFHDRSKGNVYWPAAKVSERTKLVDTKLRRQKGGGLRKRVLLRRKAAKVSLAND